MTADESFADLLAACDEALGAGTPLPSLPGGDSVVLARAVDCLKRLNRWKVDRALPAVGRFEIRRELGRGGFGVVYLAFDPRLGREVALKVPRPDVLGSPDWRKRFHREARAAAGLDHPNIVSVYEAGEAGPACYIAAAYCPGPTLREWLRQRTDPVPVADAAALVAALADGAGHAHARGIVHRDLKPGNVLLAVGSGQWKVDSEERGSASLPTTHFPLPTPKITDFGLAKLNEPGDAVTRTGAVLGTPAYMAPEQAAGAKAVGPAADVYALGAILYELLTGRPPFVGETDLDTVRQVETQEPVPPSRLRLRLPRDLETVCLKCLEKDPRRRYATAAELAADLRRYLAGQPVTARRVGPLGRAWKRARRHPVAAGLLAAVVALVVGGTTAVTVLWRQAEDAAASEAVQRGKTEAQLAEKLTILSRVEWEANNFERAREYLGECPEQHRGREWRYLDRMCRAELAKFPFTADIASRVAFSPDGRLVAAAGRTAIEVWTVADGAKAFEAELGPVHSLSLGFTPDGRRVCVLALTSAPPPPKPRSRTDPLPPPPATSWRLLSWDTTTGRPAPDSPIDWRHSDGAAAANSPAGLSAVTDGRLIRIRNVVSGQVVEFEHGHGVVGLLEFNAGGRHLLSSGPGEPVKVWEVATGRLVHTAVGSPRSRVRSSASGERA